jgi:hypothetical protein
MGGKPGRAACCVAAALVSLASGGCAGAPGGQRIVFPLTTGNVRWTGSSHIDEITDIGVPLGSNVSDATVRLVALRLVDPPAGLRMREVDAYSTRGLPFGQFPFYLGDLPAECPKYYGHPRPVSAVTVAPHSQVDWIVSIVVTMSKPGRYHFGRVKITYTSHGVQGWQYQNLHLTLRIMPPPDPGLRPLPTSAVC